MYFFRKIKYFLLLLCLSLYVPGVKADTYNKNRKIFLENTINKEKQNYYLNKNDENIFKQIKSKIQKRKWLDAYTLNEKIENIGFREAINTYISLKKFRVSNYTNEEIIKDLIIFNTQNYFLDDFKNFNNTIEFYYLNDVIKYIDVKNYFNKFKSKNIDVIIKLFNDEKSIIEEESKGKESKLMKNLLVLNNKIRKIWINENFNEVEQESFLKAFKNILTDDDIIKRAEMLVFKKDFSNLKILLSFIENNNYKILFEAIIGIEDDNKDYINYILRNLPKELREEEVLLFTKLKYYRSQGKNDKAMEILFNLKGRREFSKYWWIYRNIYARDLMKDKKYKKAYQLVSEYNDFRDENYAESQWLSGWLSFRFLNEIDRGIKHLQNYYKAVSYPASIAKASYWLGRAYFEKGVEKEALRWYNISSKYTLSYYGQLAHYAKYNILVSKGEQYKEMELPKIPEITEADIESIDKNRIVKFAFLYYNYEGRRDEANNIFKELILKLLRKKGEIAELIEAIETLDDEKVIVPLSRIASYRMVFFTDNLFPILRMFNKRNKNIALIHSIIKQESGFIVQAESGAGAIGFMQIMPTTAKLLCKQLKITYNQYKLKNDPQYNIKLGDFYINQLIKQFNGSKILAIASYNAGPKATNRWINDFGDPRKKENIEDVIDWMESITYKETRNYVQKILENLIIYESKLGINK